MNKGTWKSPNEQHIYQIVLVLMNARFSNINLEMRTKRITNSESDHFFVIIKLRVTLKVKNKIKIKIKLKRIK